MRKVEITFNEDVAQALEREALKLGMELDTFLIKIIQQWLFELAPGIPKEWMPREQWDALARGENCPLCRDLALNESANVYGYTIADLNLSRLRLVANQSVPGYCILFCKKHVREVYHLNQKERLFYFEDMMQAAQAIDRAFQPIKMNFELLGNAIPHLHCHLIPRYYGDPVPGRPINPDKTKLLLTPAEYEARVKLIRESL